MSTKTSDFNSILDLVRGLDKGQSGVFNKLRDWMVDQEDYDSIRKSNTPRYQMEEKFRKAENDWVKDKYMYKADPGNKPIAFNNNRELRNALKNSTYRSAKAVLITSIEYGIDVNGRGKTELTRMVTDAKNLEANKPETMLGDMRNKINDISYKFRINKMLNDNYRNNGILPGMSDSTIKDLRVYEAEISELAVATKGLLQSVLEEYQKTKDDIEKVNDMMEEEADA